MDIYIWDIIAYLLFSHASMANLKHVQVVPPAGEAPIDVGRNLVDDGQHGAVRARRNAGRVCGIGA